MKIAVIMPVGRDDTLIDSLIDGLINLDNSPYKVELRISSTASLLRGIGRYVLDRESFVKFGEKADLILLSYGKKKTDLDLAKEIDRWGKTIFIDGSEPGNNNRLDLNIQRQILHLEYSDYGAVNKAMLDKCNLYFRREKPYLKDVIPLPFGIESKYIKYKAGQRKDIDFVCIFGQENSPPLRRYVREELELFCAKNGFSCYTKKTKTPDEFYRLLARARVGVSVSGGGFDTLRFWEILGNNCLLMTEGIDIFQPDSGEFAYKRIYQFNNLHDFQYQLEKVGEFLREKYNKDDLTEEYQDILRRHSSEARAVEVLRKSEAKFKKDEENNNLCSILVSSYDGSEDLWEPFFTLFFRYWPDCPFPVYLISNHKHYNDPRVTTIQVGDDKGWAINMKMALKQVTTPYIMCILDDIFLERRVDTEYMVSLVRYIRDSRAAYIDLRPSPPPDIYLNNNLNLRERSKNVPNRISIAVNIWDKKTFLDLLEDGESAQDMERCGSIRSKAIKASFLCVKEQAIHFYSRAGLIRGKWIYDSVNICKKEGIKLDLSKRPIYYEEKWRFVMDNLRKNLFSKKVKEIPFLGGLMARFFWLLTFRVEKVIKK